MKKIIIVSSHFPPLNTMAAKRYGYMCKYLQENGYDYRVITTSIHGGSYIEAKSDLETDFYNDKLIHIGRLGVDYPIYDIKLALALDFCEKKNTNSRIIDKTSIGWYEKVKKEIDLKSISDAVCVIGTFPDVANIFIADYIGKKLKIPRFFEIRDLISDYSDEMKRGRIDSLREVIMEYGLLNNADALITVTEGFRRLLSNRYKSKKVVTIYNGWEGDKDQGLEEVGDYLYFAGTLYEHRIDSICLLLRVIKEYELPVYVMIRSIGPMPLVYKLKNRVKEEGLNEYIVILDAENEAIIRNEQKHALINLIPSTLDEKDEALRNTIPGKLFELLIVDRPILSIICRHTEVGNILSECNKGIATSDPQTIKEFIMDRYRLYCGNDKVEKYSRKHQTKKLCNFIDGFIEERQ